MLKIVNLEFCKTFFFIKSMQNAIRSHYLGLFAMPLLQKSKAITLDGYFN